MDRIFAHLDRLDEKEKSSFFDFILKKARRDRKLMFYLLEKILGPGEGVGLSRVLSDSPGVPGGVNTQINVGTDPETSALVHEVLRRDRKRQLAAFGDHADPPQVTDVGGNGETSDQE
jgi:hypothetical protein